MSTTKLAGVAAGVAVAFEGCFLLTAWMTSGSTGAAVEAARTVFKFCHLPSFILADYLMSKEFITSWPGLGVFVYLFGFIQFFLIFWIVLLIWRRIHEREAA